MGSMGLPVPIQTYRATYLFPDVAGRRKDVTDVTIVTIPLPEEATCTFLIEKCIPAGEGGRGSLRPEKIYST